MITGPAPSSQAYSPAGAAAVDLGAGGLLASLRAGVGNRLVVAVQVKRQLRPDLEDRAGFR